jgi:hypothetical protein
MPKVLIREYDNSTAGGAAENSFAVVVPGFFGEHTGDEKEILIDQDVYELKSQADFTKYIGKSRGIQQQGIGPVLEEFAAKAGTNDYEKYYNNLRVSDFYLEGIKAYEITELDESDSRLGKNGRLLKTITYSYQPKDANGDLIENEDGTLLPLEDRTVTILLKEVSINQVDLIKDDNGLQYTASDKYCLIKEGNEGKDEYKLSHTGNQIAYELLGLGYTVLFKKLNALTDLETETFWSPLKDKSVFNFRYVMTGGYYSVAAMNEMIKLVTFNNDVKLEDADTINNACGRGDCIALCDIDEETYNVNSNSTATTIVSNIGQAASLIEFSPYAAIFAPKVTYRMLDAAVEPFGGNKTFPASFHYLACAAKAFDKYAE